MLTPENKEVQQTVSHENRDLYQADQAKFPCIYVSMDETWAYHCDAKTKLWSSTSIHLTSQIPRNCVGRQSYGICISGQ